jgi:hypothetical protein
MRPGALCRSSVQRRGTGSSASVEPSNSKEPADACLDFVERAWWSVETEPTSRDRIDAAEYASQLGFQQIDRIDGAWHSDVRLTNQVADSHGC